MEGGFRRCPRIEPFDYRDMPLSASSSSSVAGTQDASPAAESTTTAIPTGLSTAEVQQRMVRSGANAVGETLPSFRRLLLTKLWAPVPWLLEGAIALQILLGAYIEAAIIDQHPEP